MLRQLEILDYGLIERADIAFAEGATMFTGETGSGKTMLLGALAFVLGERADVDVVRAGATKTTVALRFDPDAALRARLREDGFPIDPDEDATIVREGSATGRSSVRVNGRPATAGYVRELGGTIAEIVGQHDAQRLLSAGFHRDVLDRSGGEPAALACARVAAAHERLTTLRERARHVREDDQAVLRAVAEARALLDDVEPAALRPGEDERLNERRRLLENAERIGEALRRAHDAMSGDEGGAVTALGESARALAAIAPVSQALSALAERAAAQQSEAIELAAEIAREREAVEDDPAALEAINARSADIERLARRYGGSLEGVLAAAARAREYLDAYATRDARAAALEGEIDQAERELADAAASLTRLRASAASTLEAAVSRELGEIALGSARFAVSLEPLGEIGAQGAERVGFTFAANAGQPARALARVASGGELARLLLALVVAVAGAGDPVALVFDEIDAGIGGAAATAVGARIARLARSAQLVCITHLAQIATAADRHYVLEKREAQGTTTIGIREIESDSEREAEIARMLSGEPHDAALRHARALLRRGTARN